MPAKQHIVRLTPVERAEVRTLIAAGTAPARQLMHARILLKADAGSGGPRWTDARIAEALQLKRPARVYARRLDGAGEAGVVVLACSDPPAGHARWTLRLLASRLVELKVVDGIAPETVRQTLKKRRSSHG